MHSEITGHGRVGDAPGVISQWLESNANCGHFCGTQLYVTEAGRWRNGNAGRSWGSSSSEYRHAVDGALERMGETSTHLSCESVCRGHELLTGHVENSVCRRTRFSISRMASLVYKMTNSSRRRSASRYTSFKFMFKWQPGRAGCRLLRLLSGFEHRAWRERS